MSKSKNKRKELSTKEDKLIESTLFLTQDNKNKLNLINKLNDVSTLIEGLGFDSNQKSNVLLSIKDASSSIKASCEATKIHMRRVNPTAHETEEAFEIIQKSKPDSNVDVARILFNMHNIGATQP